jgi:hypothetical protein
MELKAFSSNAVDLLLENLELNSPLYRKDKAWALDFLKDHVTSVISTRISVPRGIELQNPDEGNRYDLDNSIILHQSLPGLSPVQARDPRLWTYLAHVDCWGYMQARWGDVSKGLNYIKEHYFVASDASRALSRHGIARLWWYGHLSFDESRSNPYELTAVLLDKLDITQTVLERSLGRNRVVRLTFLEFLLENNDLFLKSGDRGRLAVRALAKSLNLHGGDCLLDALRREDIRAVFNKELPRLQSDYR